MVLLLPRVRGRLEFRGERLLRIETRSRNTHPYRSPVCRDDGSYFVRLFAARMVGLRKASWADGRSHVDDRKHTGQNSSDDSGNACSVPIEHGRYCCITSMLRQGDHLHPQSSHALPCRPSIPSLAMTGTIIKAATGSAHHHPSAAFRSRPASRMTDK